MNVLLDIHHHDLFRSLYILFYTRLKYNIYVPCGLDWNTEYKYADYKNENTISQYLIEVKNWLNCGNDVPNVTFITLEEYKNIKINIHVSSLLENAIVFKKLIADFHPYSKHIIQVGNNFPVECIDHIGKNLLSSSTVVYNKSKIKNKLFYHQEFDTNLFCLPINIINPYTVNSFQHYFGIGMIPYEKDYDEFKTLKKLMPNFKYTCFGLEGDGGCIPGIPTCMSNAIKESGFIYHVKPQGDGFGHIYHNAIACGKPVIYRSEYLMSNEVKMTPLLLFNDKNSIDLSVLSHDEAKDKINYFAENYEDISKKIYDEFKNIINFDLEFENIKKFINNLE